MGQQLMSVGLMIERPSSLEKVLILGKNGREEKRITSSKIEEYRYRSDGCTAGRPGYRCIVREKICLVLR